MANRSSRAVYLAAQVRDTTFAFWEISVTGVRSIKLDDVPAGGVVLRIAGADIRFMKPANRKPTDHARSTIGLRSSVRQGSGRIYYATALADVWMDQARRVRAAPVFALLDAARSRQTLQAPAVLGIHLAGELLVLWALGRDGALKAPLVVIPPPTDDAVLTARVTGFASEHGVPVEHVGLLEGADVLALAGVVQPYPLADEWAGRPATFWLSAAAGVAGFILGLSVFTRTAVEQTNQTLRAQISRERDHSGLYAERQELVRAHVVAYARLDSARPADAMAVATVVTAPGGTIVIAQRGRGTEIRVTQEYRIDPAAVFYPERLDLLFKQAVPAGFLRHAPILRDGGSRVEVVYEQQP